MIDHSRHQSITDSPISNSTVNFGDNSQLSNTIQQLPEGEHELKALLIALTRLIDQSSLDDAVKEDACSELNNLAEASQQPAEQRQSVVARSLRALKRIGNELSDVPEVMKTFGEMIEQFGELL